MLNTHDYLYGLRYFPFGEQTIYNVASRFTAA